LGEHVSGVQYAEALRWMEIWRHRLRRRIRSRTMRSYADHADAGALADGRDFIEAIRANHAD
jgi:hypothetical protein